MTSIDIGGRLNALALAGGRMWTGEFKVPRLAAVDPVSVRRVNGLRPEVGIGLDGVAAAGRSLWVIASRDRRLVEIDGRTGRSLGAPVALPAAASAVVANEDAAWVSITRPELDPGDQILRIDGRSHAITQTLDVGDGVRRLVLARGGLWFLASQPAGMTRIDLRTGKRFEVRLQVKSAGDLAWGAGDVGDSHQHRPARPRRSSHRQRAHDRDWQRSRRSRCASRLRLGRQPGVEHRDARRRPLGSRRGRDRGAAESLRDGYHR